MKNDKDFWKEIEQVYEENLRLREKGLPSWLSWWARTAGIHYWLVGLLVSLGLTWITLVYGNEIVMRWVMKGLWL